ncbi:MAG: hypothetical protein HJJLKODD_00569 [Phycisphaerae bacterium]|nr:hypothetical protein [Phycisphaerae bacterium]
MQDAIGGMAGELLLSDHLAVWRPGVLVNHISRRIRQTGHIEIAVLHIRVQRTNQAELFLEE